MPIETVQECLREIFAGVDGDIDDLPKGATVAWFHTNHFDKKTSTPLPTIFRVSEVSPIDPFSRVMGIFHNDDVIRVYTLPTAPPTPRPEAWIDRPPTRYALSRTAPTYVAETMNLDAFAAETIKEWNALAHDGDEGPDADDELLAVVEYIERRNGETGGMLALTKLVEELSEGAHRPDDEEEEEDTEPVPSTTPALPATATPTTPAAPTVSS